MPETDVGESIPPLTAHAVSVSLPTWKSCVAYEEGQDWVVGRMKTGYPSEFANAVLKEHGKAGESALLFPSAQVAQKFESFLSRSCPELACDSINVIELGSSLNSTLVSASVWACLFPTPVFPIAKQFWQHSGDGISSRRAEYCYSLFKAGLLPKKPPEGEQSPCKGPKRYQKAGLMRNVQSHNPDTGLDGHGSHVEERFGRNLSISLTSNAKVAIKRRIAGLLAADMELEDALRASPQRQNRGFSEDDVYLYPSGMSAIFNAHQCLMAARQSLKSVCYGFPYIDTLKILEKFGPGCIFYGHGSQEELQDLEVRLKSGERILALFCEFPGNPLLKSPDLATIRRLADEHDFAVVVDDTIGNFLNVNVLQYVDIAVSSLTKMFSGSSNVMGGSAILNPQSKYYDVLKRTWAKHYEDNYWAEDALFMERNSRDFISRAERVNDNAEAICSVLRAHPRVKAVYYPKYNATKAYYDNCRKENGGYGGLLSTTFHSKHDAMRFYDALQTAKGPSLGTNFTLSCPYVILAHFCELGWAASFGVEAELIRFSVGLEDTAQLTATFESALASLSAA